MGERIMYGPIVKGWTNLWMYAKCSRAICSSSKNSYFTLCI